ncbi:MAG: nucleotidyltransferase domain-containing protein [Patescibacteria group bacterium]|nr:nucleotidyltransferase domain-containing protein [Patescibacteria group bacterium]MBU1160734.1 nucleotidyltransferase domain-containing protein [Patescibacteria group bacterium]MBU1778161.1 nucleotidyltransferase domain-containing protein [Patescibacteria group bacterium]MBU1987228.1 nucleotidyltransferase domain-containing protein [Patescibacteria group bacterium]
MAENILSKRQINNLVKRLAKKAREDKMPISRAFVFGSYARNKANKNSDLDLCFISPKFKDTIQVEAYLRTEICFFKNPEYNIPIDIVACRPREFQATAPLVYEIMEHGKEIKLK